MTTYQSYYQSYAVKSAKNARINPSIFLSLINSESGFNPAAVNGSAIGIAQILDSTAKDPGYGLQSVDPSDPFASLDFASQYYAKLKKLYGSDSMAIGVYKGFKNNLTAGTDKIKKVIDDAKNTFYDYGRFLNEQAEEAVELIEKEQSKSYDEKSLWQFSADDWGDWIKDSIPALSIGTVGFLIIIFAILAIFFSSNDVKTVISTAIMKKA